MILFRLSIVQQIIGYTDSIYNRQVVLGMKNFLDEPNREIPVGGGVVGYFVLPVIPCNLFYNKQYVFITYIVRNRSSRKSPRVGSTFPGADSRSVE